MSSNNNNNVPTPQQQPQVDADNNNNQEEEQPQQQKQQKQQKSTSWAKKSHMNTRSAGIDVIKRSLGAEINVDQSKTSFLNLPIVPAHVSDAELIKTGSSDFTSTVESLNQFFETSPLLPQRNFFLQGTAVHCRNGNANFSCYLYRTQDGEIAYHVTRVEGCGIAFARLYHALNQELGSNKQRDICTFEAPQLSPLSCDQQLVEQTPTIAASLQSINDMLTMMQASSQQMRDDDGEFIAPIAAKAQSAMITQSFDTINASLLSISNDEVQQLTAFTNKLFDQNTQQLSLLLAHPHLDVKIKTVEFLTNVVVPSLPQLAQQLPVDLLFSLYDESEQIIAEEQYASPFQALQHQALMAQIATLQQLCSQ